MIIARTSLIRPSMTLISYTIYGPIANDKVGAQIRNFKSGSISLDELMRRIKYLKGITFQYYFGTETAIKTLHKL